MRTSGLLLPITHTYTIPLQADDVGLGIIETPLAMTLSEAADGVTEGIGIDMLPDADADSDADGVTVLKGRLATIAAASLGETVVVLTNELAPVSVELELDDEEPLPLSPFLRTRADNVSTSMSMKVSSGPATIALLSRSMTPPFKGWSSLVIQIATAPFRPCGTTHTLSGREREKGMPAASIWQWKFCELVDVRSYNAK